MNECVEHGEIRDLADFTMFFGRSEHGGVGDLADFTMF